MNKRILFVDADPLLMDFHALVREKAAAQWKIARAENCDHALQILATKNFDAVVSDLRTPGTNGAVLMQAIRRLYPRTARISISELDDQKKTSASRTLPINFWPTSRLRNYLRRYCAPGNWMRSCRMKI